MRGTLPQSKPWWTGKNSIILALAACLCVAAPATVKRSHAAIAAFKRANPCPATGRPSGKCPGYVIDHINPLACGGEDAPSNMQWQTRAESLEKDRWERIGCKKIKNN
jgi:hypothetical protein